MNEMRDILLHTANRLFQDHCGRATFDQFEAGKRPDMLWDQIGEAGLWNAGLPEEMGGAGISPEDLCALLMIAGEHALPAPLAEVWMGQQALLEAGLPVDDLRRTIGPVLHGDTIRLRRRASGWLLSGALRRIPWYRFVDGIVVIAESEDGPRTVIVDQHPPTRTSANWADEPRDDLVFDDVGVEATRVSDPNVGWTVDQLIFRGALYRTMLMRGALARVLSLTVRYAQERVQFGKPIGKFQAIQQQIALLASQVAAASAAADGAMQAVGLGEQASRFETACAKARVAEAVAVASEIAHGVHAAMGFSREHDLNRYTRRLWSWREEFGSDNRMARMDRQGGCRCREANGSGSS